MIAKAIGKGINKFPRERRWCKGIDQRSMICHESITSAKGKNSIFEKGFYIGAVWKYLQNLNQRQITVAGSKLWGRGAIGIDYRMYASLALGWAIGGILMSFLLGLLFLLYLLVWEKYPDSEEERLIVKGDGATRLAAEMNIIALLALQLPHPFVFYRYIRQWWIQTLPKGEFLVRINMLRTFMTKPEVREDIWHSVRCLKEHADLEERKEFILTFLRIVCHVMKEESLYFLYLREKLLQVSLMLGMEQDAFEGIENDIRMHRELQENRELLKKAYQRLGLSENSTVADIKSRYREMAKKFHPDKCPDEKGKNQYNHEFVELQRAYDIIKQHLKFK